MNNEEIHFIKKFSKLVDIFTFCLGTFWIDFVAVLITTSVPGIIFDQWNNKHYLNFVIVEIGIYVFIAVATIIATLCILVMVSKVRKKLESLVNRNTTIQESFANQSQASSTISLNHAAAEIIGDGKYNIGNAIVDFASTVSIVLNIRTVAKTLVSYLPESERPKSVNFKYIFIIVSILFLFSTVFGIRASLKDKTEIIKNREEIVEKIKSVYYDYNPLPETSYIKKYYDDSVDINLNNGSVINVRMDKGGQGKITGIKFISKERVSTNQNTKTILDKLLIKTEILYQRTDQYKEYYKEIFRNRTPIYRMDEEHKLDLVQKLEDLLSKRDSTIKIQNQYQQYRDEIDKTAVSQDIYLKYEEDYVILELSISEHRMK